MVDPTPAPWLLSRWADAARWDLCTLKHQYIYTLKIQPKTCENKDFTDRGTKRVCGFIAQQIAEVIPDAVSTQKNPSYDIYNFFKYNDYIVHIDINEYEGTYNVGDKSSFTLTIGEFDCTIT